MPALRTRPSTSGTSKISPVKQKADKEEKSTSKNIPENQKSIKLEKSTPTNRKRKNLKKIYAHLFGLGVFLFSEHGFDVIFFSTVLTIRPCADSSKKSLWNSIKKHRKSQNSITTPPKKNFHFVGRGIGLSGRGRGIGLSLYSKIF
jgi:hypothetical protein